MSFKTVEIGLPFYDSTEKQGKQKPYFGTYLTDWKCPIDQLPSFQFYRDDSNVVTSVLLINADSGGTVLNLTTYFDSTKTVVGYNGAFYYLYESQTGAATVSGRYYIEASSSTRTWYSEIFVVCDV